MQMQSINEAEAAGVDTGWEAQEFFESKLRYETDPADVYADIEKDKTGFVLLDARSWAAYREKHVVGAISMPHSSIDRTRLEPYPADTLFVVYCWGPGCNGSSKAALKLARLGYRVKEMIGGIEYWEREGLPLAMSE